MSSTFPIAILNGTCFFPTVQREVHKENLVLGGINTDALVNLHTKLNSAAGVGGLVRPIVASGTAAGNTGTIQAPAGGGSVVLYGKLCGEEDLALWEQQTSTQHQHHNVTAPTHNSQHHHHHNARTGEHHSRVIGCCSLGADFTHCYTLQYIFLL